MARSFLQKSGKDFGESGSALAPSRSCTFRSETRSAPRVSGAPRKLEWALAPCSVLFAHDTLSEIRYSTSRAAVSKRKARNHGPRLHRDVAECLSRHNAERRGDAGPRETNTSRPTPEMRFDAGLDDPHRHRKFAV